MKPGGREGRPCKMPVGAAISRLQDSAILFGRIISAPTHTSYSYKSPSSEFTVILTNTLNHSSPITFKQRLYSSSLAISPILYKSQMLSNCAWKSSKLIISLFIIIPTYRTFITPYCFSVIKPYPICSCPYLHFITASITYFLLHLSHPLFNIRPYHLSDCQQERYDQG